MCTPPKWYFFRGAISDPIFPEFSPWRSLVVLPASPEVTMIQDSACKQDKPPFDSYGDLTAAGVDVKLADLQNGGPGISAW